jgi:hypothetical protein
MRERAAGPIRFSAEDDDFDDDDVRGENFASQRGDAADQDTE